MLTTDMFVEWCCVRLHVNDPALTKEWRVDVFVVRQFVRGHALLEALLCVGKRQLQRAKLFASGRPAAKRHGNACRNCKHETNTSLSLENLPIPFALHTRLYAWCAETVFSFQTRSRHQNIHMLIKNRLLVPHKLSCSAAHCCWWRPAGAAAAALPAAAAARRAPQPRAAAGAAGGGREGRRRIASDDAAAPPMLPPLLRTPHRCWRPCGRRPAAPASQLLESYSLY